MPAVLDIPSGISYFHFASLKALANHMQELLLEASNGSRNNPNA